MLAVCKRDVKLQEVNLHLSFKSHLRVFLPEFSSIYVRISSDDEYDVTTMFYWSDGVCRVMRMQYKMFTFPPSYQDTFFHMFVTAGDQLESPTFFATLAQRADLVVSMMLFAH